MPTPHKLLLATHEREFVRRGVSHQRWMRALLAAVVGLIISLAIVILVMLNYANRSASLARETAAKSFLRTIGTSSDRDPSLEEVEALWDLAELSAPSEEVRNRILKEWFRDDARFLCAARRGGIGLHAAIGVSPTRMDICQRLARGFANELVTELEGATEESVIVGLGAALVELGYHLETRDAAHIASLLATSASRTEDMNQLLQLILVLDSLGGNLTEKEGAAISSKILAAMTNDRQWSRIRPGIDSLCGMLPPEVATDFALQAIAENAEETQPSARSWRWGPRPNWFEHLARRLPPEQLLVLTNRVISAMEDAGGAGNFWLADLDRILTNLSSHLPPEETKVFVEQLLVAMEKSAFSASWRETEQLGGLAQALARLDGNLDPETAARAVEQVVQAMERTSQMTNTSRSARLAFALGCLSDQLSADVASTFAARIFASMSNTTHFPQLVVLGSSLESLSRCMSAEETTKVAEQIMLVMKDVDIFEQLAGFASALEHLCRNLPPGDARVIAEQLFKTMGEEEGKLTNLARLGVWLSKLAGRLPTQAASELAAKVEGSRDFSELVGLAYWMETSLGRQFSEKESAALATQLMEAMARTQDSEKIRFLGKALGRLSGLLPSAEANKAAQLIIVTIGHSRDHDVTAELLSNLLSICRSLSASEVANVSKGLAIAILEAPDTKTGALLGDGVVRLAEQRSAQASTGIAAKLLSEMVRVAIPPRKSDTSDFKVAQFDALGHALVHVCERLPTRVTESATKQLVTEMPRAINHKALASLASTLARFDKRLPQRDAEGAARLLFAAMEASTYSKESEGLSELRMAVELLCGHLSEGEAANGALKLLRAIERSNTASQLSSLGAALALLGERLNTTEDVYQLGISAMLVRPITELASEDAQRQADRRLFVRFCSKGSAEELKEVLKWPFCTGEAGQIVLAQLETKLSERGASIRFDGKIENFVEQASALGMGNLDGPARRPTSGAVRSELERLLP